MEQGLSTGANRDSISVRSSLDYHLQQRFVKYKLLFTVILAQAQILTVIPAKARIHSGKPWIPAFAGMTTGVA